MDVRGDELSVVGRRRGVAAVQCTIAEESKPKLDLRDEQRVPVSDGEFVGNLDEVVGGRGGGIEDLIACLHFLDLQQGEYMRTVRDSVKITFGFNGMPNFQWFATRVMNTCGRCVI